MILRIDPPGDVQLQMRRDAEALEAAIHGGADEPVLRLFRFEPAGITLGASQVAERELDLARCERDGVPFAHRPTGGRAILHADEWTFSLIARLGPGGWAADARGAYARTAELFARALGRLGVPVALSPTAERGGGAPRVPGGPAAPCFASTARHELLLEGRKCVGIAQRRARDVLLQQGSVLLGPGHERLADYLAIGTAERAALRARLAAASAEIGGWLGESRGVETLAHAVEASGDGLVRRVPAAPVGRLMA